MALLQRQRSGTPVKMFTVRMPEEKYNALADFALANRLALTTAVTHLVSNALEAETGKQYIPFAPKGGAQATTNSDGETV